MKMKESKSKLNRRSKMIKNCGTVLGGGLLAYILYSVEIAEKYHNYQIAAVILFTMIAGLALFEVIATTLDLIEKKVIAGSDIQDNSSQSYNYSEYTEKENVSSSHTLNRYTLKLLLVNTLTSVVILLVPVLIMVLVYTAIENNPEDFTSGTEKQKSRSEQATGISSTEQSTTARSTEQYSVQNSSVLNPQALEATADPSTGMQQQNYTHPEMLGYAISIVDLRWMTVKLIALTMLSIPYLLIKTTHRYSILVLALVYVIIGYLILFKDMSNSGLILASYLEFMPSIVIAALFMRTTKMYRHQNL